ncbi:MAG: signal peptidase II [Clostridia bacterium]|nr:signal peptidase II [Clostridia bacterium]
MTSIIISVVLMVVAVVLDQVSKLIVVSNMDLHESIAIIPDVFHFTYIQNRGAAFGSFDEHRWVFLILSTVAIIAILAFLFWKKPQDKLLLASLILISGGGIGNMIDRVRLGYVIDFLDFCAFPNLWMWIFNVADAFVCIGAGMLALWMILDTVRDIKKEKAQKLTEAIETAVVDESENNATENGGEEHDS